MVRLEGALDRHSQVFGLGGGQGREAGAELGQVEVGDLLVEVLGQTGDGAGRVGGLSELVGYRP